MKILSAPLQGLTSSVWRNTHNSMFGGVDEYYTPFIRIEKGAIRKRDLTELDRTNNTVPILIPQIIGSSNPVEIKQLVETVVSKGYAKIDINLGCPFPLIAKKKMGSGILTYPEEVEKLIEILKTYSSDVQFSVKSRLGWESPEEILQILPIIKSLSPTHLTIHPRLGVQQYEGDVDIEVFTSIYDKWDLPLVYNGDITSKEEYDKILTQFPNLDGIMIGRGLLMNPALSRVIRGGDEMTTSELLEFHGAIFDHYKSTLCGDAHILAKLKPYWEYLYPELDRKIKKAIKKSVNLKKYELAISMIK